MAHMSSTESILKKFDLVKENIDYFLETIESIGEIHDKSNTTLNILTSKYVEIQKLFASIDALQKEHNKHIDKLNEETEKAISGFSDIMSKYSKLTEKIKNETVDLCKLRTSIENGVKTFDEIITSKTNMLEKTIEERIQQLSKSIYSLEKNLDNKINGNIDEVKNELREYIDSRIDQFISNQSALINEMKQKLKDIVVEKEELDHKRESVDEWISEADQKLNTKLVEMDKAIRESISIIVDKFKNLSKELSDEIENKIALMNGQLLSHIDEKIDKFLSWQKSMIDNITQRIDSQQGRLESIDNKIKKQGEFNSKIGRAINNQKDTILNQKTRINNNEKIIGSHQLKLDNIIERIEKIEKKKIFGFIKMSEKA